MDPLTILALAKASYEAIKTGISVGKEMQGMFGDVMSLLDSAGKLSRIAARPPKCPPSQVPALPSARPPN